MAPTKIELPQTTSTITTTTDYKNTNGHSKSNGHMNGGSGDSNGMVLTRTSSMKLMKGPVAQNEDNSDGTEATSKSAQALKEVRRLFLEYCERNPNKVHKRDKHKLATDDWYLKRYLLARNRRVSATMDMLCKTMEWRNENGLHMSEDPMYPAEFYKIGALFPYESDKGGNLVVYLRIKYHKKVDQMVDTEKHFLVHTFEKIDRLTNGSGLVLVFDCQGAGYANCDLEFMYFLITCATEHAPVGLKYIIVYKLPWILNTFWNVVKKVLPPYLSSRVRFCDEKSIREFIEPENLPDFMNGTCKRNYRWIPPGCPSVFKLASSYGIPDTEVERLLPQFQQFLDEAEEALANNEYEEPPEAVTKYVNNPESAVSFLTDAALLNLGLITPEQVAATSGQLDSSLRSSSTRDAAAIVRVFPEDSIELTYDSFNDSFFGTMTLLNPSKVNSLAFKLMTNRPSSYSVKPARGVLLPDSTVTLSVVLVNEHKPNDKFLLVAQPLEGQVSSITKNEFDSLWSKEMPLENHTNIKFGSHLRKLSPVCNLKTSALTPRSPRLGEVWTNCNSLKRKVHLSLVLNVMIMTFFLHWLFYIS